MVWHIHTKHIETGMRVCEQPGKIIAFSSIYPFAILTMTAQNENKKQFSQICFYSSFFHSFIILFFFQYCNCYSNAVLF